MKKFLKRFYIIVFVSVALFSNVNSVEAVAVTKGDITATGMEYGSDSTSGSKTNEHYNLNTVPSGAVLNADGTKREGLKYNKHTINGQTAYCLDASLGSTKDVYAGRFLFTDQDTVQDLNPNDKIYVYDLAITSSFSGSYADYFQQSLAIRAISATFGNLNWGGQDEGDGLTYNYVQDQYKAFYGTAYKWIQEDPEIAQYINVIKGVDSGVGSNLSSYSNYYWEGNLDGAKNAFKTAMKAAAEHVSNLGNNATLEVNPDSVPSNLTETEDANGNLLEKSNMHVGTINRPLGSADDKATLIIHGVELDKNIKGVKLITTVTIGGNVVCSGETECFGKNLLEGVTDTGAVPWSVKVEAKGYKTVNEGSSEEKLSCEDQKMHYVVKYTYGGGAFDGQRSDLENNLGVVWRNQKNAKDKQRFITDQGEYTPNGSDEPKMNDGTIEGDIALLEDCDCDSLKEKCIETGDPNSQECKDYLDICDGCDALDVVCTMDKEQGNNDSEACKKYVEENCATCEELFNACIDSGDINSQECNDYKSKRGELGCSEDCNEWRQLCSIGDQESCDKYDRDPKCTPQTEQCGTQIKTVTECCDEGGDALLVDPAFSPTIGMMGDYGQLYEIHGVKENEIKMCFVDMVDNNTDPIDEKNNKYKMETDSSVINNQFCKVNCREDYAINFPIAQRVNAGRYFTFQMSMESHKQCFTNTIDREKYKEIIEALLVRIEKDANLYAEYYKAWEHATIEHPQIPVYETCISHGPCDGCGERVYTRHIWDGGETDGGYIWTKTEFTFDYDRMEITNIKETKIKDFKSKNSEVNHPPCAGGVHHYDRDGNDLGCFDCGVTYDEVVKEWTLSEWKETVLRPVWENALADYKAAFQQLQDTIAEYKACSEWQTEYNPDPSVQYDYEEGYRQSPYLNPSMPVDMDGEYLASGTDYQFCNLEWNYNQDKVKVDDKYQSCIGGSGFGGDSKDQLDYTKCSMSGGEPGCVIDTKTLSKSIYKKSNSDAEGEYKPQTLFYNIYPSGEITVDSSRVNVDAVALERKLPVALSTPKGVRRYYINTSNIGEYYKDGSQGRFAGNGNSIIGDSIDYTCSYLINIPEATMKCSTLDNPCDGPDCSTECIGPGCGKDFECDGVDCVTDCVGIGCIYDKNAGTSLLQKQVSLNSMFPNGTDAYNWTNAKGAAVRSEIEEAGNSIYDTTPILSLTINPSVSRSIKNYNKDNENNGGYSNETVKCQNVSAGERLACYSDFISKLIAGEFGDAQVKLGAERNNPESYFQFWTSGISEAGMIGPAYR